MINNDEVEKIKSAIESLLQKMAVTALHMDLKLSSAIFANHASTATADALVNGVLDELKTEPRPSLDVVDVDLQIDEPKFLIGQDGQTLFELQNLLRMMLVKKLKKLFYLRLDINDYRKKKIEYLKDLAKHLADEAVITKEKKVLPPMPSYERRIIHMELAGRQDIITESQGEGLSRCVVIKPVV